MGKRRWSGILAALAISGCLVLLIVWGKLGSPTSPSPSDASRPLPVTTLTARPLDSYEVEREFTGRLVAARSSQLAFERMGRVVEVIFDVGDEIAAGQVIAKLDTRHLVARRRQLDAQMRQAVARLDELVAGPRAEQIAAAEAEVRSLSAQARLQQLNVDRRQELRRSGAVAQEEFDSARFGLESISAQLDVARERLKELQTGSRPEQIAAARAEVEQLEASLEMVDHDLEDCRLEAPYAGTIAERFVDEGVVITPQTPIVQLIEQGRLEAWIGLPAEQAATLLEGQQVSLRCQNKDLTGTVEGVLPNLDQATRTRQIVVTLPQSTSFVAGQLVRLTIREQIPTECFALPTTALIGGSRGLWSCFAVATDPEGDLRVERRDVEVLHTTGEFAMVRGTLRDGESIVADGVHRIAAGQRVHMVAPDQQPSTMSLVQDAGRMGK